MRKRFLSDSIKETRQAVDASDDILRVAPHLLDVWENRAKKLERGVTAGYLLWHALAGLADWLAEPLRQRIRETGDDIFEAMNEVEAQDAVQRYYYETRREGRYSG